MYAIQTSGCIGERRRMNLVLYSSRKLEVHSYLELACKTSSHEFVYIDDQEITHHPQKFQVTSSIDDR